MGLFDSVYMPCPQCGKGVEFQSKARDEGCGMDVWDVDGAPDEVVRDVINDPQYCRHCGCWSALVDPAFPPGWKPPRPQPQMRLVRTPENPHIHSTQAFLRWWPDDEPFTHADVLPE